MTNALVLSGGGAVGIAWELALAAGLARGGLDAREADFIAGTSAGSAVGAQLALGRDPAELARRHREAAVSRPRPAERPGGASGDEQMAKLLELIAVTMTGEGPPQARRAAVGRFALDAGGALPEDAFVAEFRYLRGEPWPARFACPAIDAVTGEFVVWDGPSGVELDRAVASSCAVPGLFAPVTISGRRYIDGGFRSPTNADLARGHDRVLVISLFPPVREAGTSDVRFLPGRQFAEEIDALTASGSAVEVISADEGSARALGVNLMDSSAIPAAVDEGLRQGEAEAGRLLEFWSAG